MFRKPIFWIVFVFAVIGCVVYSAYFFNRAFPIVSIDLQMDRETALISSRTLAERYGWGPEGYEQAASFISDSDVQNFVELEAGGKEAFSSMLKDELYFPYQWTVRHFKEGKTNETIVRFTPNGKPYGFTEKIPEDEPGTNIPADSARAIAMKRAKDEWSINVSDYELVEESDKVQTSDRIDHTFVYERKDVQLGEGRYRLRLVVSGNRLTELVHFVKIPEAFSRRYAEMRSANDTIAFGGFIGMAVLYMLGGCIIGLFILLRQRQVIWKAPLIWGIFAAFLLVLAEINKFPLIWMDYDTALSSEVFFMKQVLRLLLIFLGFSALHALSFMAAESLTRKAFPDHIQFWRLWSRDAAGSPDVLGRTAGGYLMVGITIALLVTFYFLMTKLLGWWNPSDALIHPDVLATYFPWLSSIAISLHAGFWEESLFRAVPIAGAALIGQRYGCRKAWIAAALVLQAVIFGAGHASYPSQPAYARLIELIVPSIIYGGIYLCFGLLPVIITHFTYDVIFIAVPLFVSSAPGIWFNQAMVVILMFVPLWVVLVSRLRNREWRKLKEEHYNRAWKAPEKEEPEAVPEAVSEIGKIGGKTIRILPVLGIVGLLLWFLAAHFKNDAPSLSINRNNAQTLARKTLSDGGVELPESWHELSSVGGRIDNADRFVWKTGGKEKYREMMNKNLDPPHWSIRYVQFEGDVAERAEEFEVRIAGDGKVMDVVHRLPEKRPGDSLSIDEARIIAGSVITAKYNLNIKELKEVSAEPFKLPARKDWLFTYADTLSFPLEEGEDRIFVWISGDEVSYAVRGVHVPEVWEREERNRQNYINILYNFCSIFLRIFILVGAVFALVSWSRRKFSPKVFWKFFLLLFGIQIVTHINGWPGIVADFSTAMPYSNQYIIAVTSAIIVSVLYAAILALAAGYIHYRVGEQSPLSRSKAVWLGWAAGAVITGLLASSRNIVPSLEPNWASYGALNSFYPLLNSIFTSFSAYIADTIWLLLAITFVNRFSNGWTRRKSISAVILVSFGMFISGSFAIESAGYWIVFGLVTGFLLLWVYLSMFRFHPSLIPLVIGFILILGSLAQAFLLAFPGAVMGEILSVVCIGLFSVYWFNNLQTAGQSIREFIPQ